MRDNEASRSAGRVRIVLSPSIQFNVSRTWAIVLTVVLGGISFIGLLAILPFTPVASVDPPWSTVAPLVVIPICVVVLLVSSHRRWYGGGRRNSTSGDVEVPRIHGHQS
jgi:hypothetical protein